MARLLAVLLLACAITFAFAQKPGKLNRVTVGCADNSLGFKDAVENAVDGTVIEVCGEVNLGCHVYVRNQVKIVANKKTGATLEDFTLKFKCGSEGSSVSGFHFKDAKIIGKADAITVKDNTFSCTYEPITVYGRDGWVITGNTFKWGDSCSYAIGFEGDATGLTIENNYIDGSFGAGIAFDSCSLATARSGGVYVADVSISNNNFAVDQALYFNNGGLLENLAIDGNTFTGSEGVVLCDVCGEFVSISGNTFTCQAGIELEDSFLAAATIDKNTFNQWHYTAIKMTDVDMVASSISKNFVENSKYGIKIKTECGNDIFFAGNTINQNTISSNTLGLYIKENVKVCESQIAGNKFESDCYSFAFDGSAFIHNQVANNKYDSDNFYKLSDDVCRVVDSDFFQNVYFDFQQDQQGKVGKVQPIAQAAAQAASANMAKIEVDDEQFFEQLKAKRMQNNIYETMAKNAVLDDGEEEDVYPAAAESHDVNAEIDAIIRQKLTEALANLPESEIEAIVNREVSEIRAEMLSGFRVNHSMTEAVAQASSGNNKIIAAAISFAVGLVATLIGAAIYRRAKKTTYSAI